MILEPGSAAQANEEMSVLCSEFFSSDFSKPDLLGVIQIIAQVVSGNRDYPCSEFALFSECHTAELTEESITEEGLHLAAAVQYSGFRSVAATMWAIVDIDGQILAKHFYGSLFSER
jgi:CHAT domain-containing protein